MTLKQSTDQQQRLAEEAAEVTAWAAGLEAMAERIGPHFARTEARRRAGLYLKGLLSPIERKNGWQLAEEVGDQTPYGVQHLLGRAEWDADAVRDDVRAYGMEHLADPQGVQVIDETGFLKKGTKSAGVQRQYSGTAGRIENCQVGVFLTYASPKGRTFQDRELYLPKDWCADQARREEAGIPEGVVFATKAQLAHRMLERSWAAGVRAGWVTADEVYGHDSKFRRWLEGEQQPFVLAVQSDQTLRGSGYARVDEAAAILPKKAWRRLSAGNGSKGPRLYDWACLEWGRADGWSHWLLVRRSLTNLQDLAYYFVFAPSGTPLEEMVRVAGTRWTIEECFEAAKGEVGLDQYEVRKWHGWYRHITLAMAAHAWLTVIRNQAEATSSEKKGAQRRRRPGMRQFRRSRGL